TMQMLVSLTDTSNPAKWSMLRFSFCCLRPLPRTSFHHQPEAQHPKFFSLSTSWAGRLPHLYPDEPTSSARTLTSEKCHYQTSRGEAQTSRECPPTKGGFHEKSPEPRSSRLSRLRRVPTVSSNLKLTTGPLLRSRNGTVQKCFAKRLLTRALNADQFGRMIIFHYVDMVER